MIPVRFNISPVSSSLQLADFELNVQDDYRNLVYVGKPDSDQVPISYIGIPSPHIKDIDIKHLDESPAEINVLENSFRLRFKRVFSNKIFTIPVRNALITDIVNLEDTGRPVPLFYKHILDSNFAVEPEIIDHTGRQVPNSHYKVVVQDNEVAVYHDLEPTYNDTNLAVKAYYIRYTDLSGEVISGLLESDPAFEEANILDGVDRRNRVYAVREAGPYYRYSILYMGEGPYYLKATQDHQLKINKPLFVLPNSPWNIRISDGSIGAANIDGSQERYSIPEYHLQQFSPIEPYQFNTTSECLVLNEHLVKTPHNHLIDDADHVIDVLVTTEDLEPKSGWTTGPTAPKRYWVDRFDRWHAQGRRVSFELAPSSRGLSINKRHGFMHIPIELDPTYRVFIRATREVKDYTYLGLNLNPLQNSLMNTSRAVIYVVPRSELDEFQIAIYHLLLDNSDSIVGWDDPRLGEDELDVALVPGVGETGYGLFKTEHPKNLIIGEVSVNRGIALSDISFIDVRQSGNTLTDKAMERLPEILDSTPEALWVADPFVQERSIPLLGTLKVEAPFEMLGEGGGDISREDFEQLAKKHTALGSHAIIEYYADIPDILDIQLDTNTNILTIVWSSVSHAYSYRIYIGDKPRAINYTLETSGSTNATFQNALEYDIQLNGDTIDNPDIVIIPEDKIYLYIAPLVDDIEWPASRVGYIDVTTTGNIAPVSFHALLESPPTTSVTLHALLT